MSELLGKVGGLGKHSEIWRGAETQPGGEFKHSNDSNCTFCCYKRLPLFIQYHKYSPESLCFA